MQIEEKPVKKTIKISNYKQTIKYIFFGFPEQIGGLMCSTFKERDYGKNNLKHNMECFTN